jgi:hypothetical protein
MYRTLDAAKIIDTLVRLEQRISERFAGAGLARVCAELTDIARQTHVRSSEIARPNILLRAFVCVFLAACATLIAYVSYRLWSTTRVNNDLYSILQAIGAVFNILALMGASLFSLVRIEEILKRRRAIRALHELRSIIHVIDMHQLTKDPSAEEPAGAPTKSSPKRSLSPYALCRYLDYCSEMLSLAAKVSVLYAQSFPDPVVTEAVNDLERTSASLSQKIWQKINIIERTIIRAPAP